MYYPYLRAKQYELKALKEFSQAHPNQQVITPVLEPVKMQLNALNAAIDTLLNHGMRFALVLNPRDGDFKHPTVHLELPDLNDRLMSEKDRWIPAFVYSRKHANEIPVLMGEYGLKNAMLVFRTCMDMEDTVAWGFLTDPAVQYIVNDFGTTVSRRLRSRLNETGKQIIRLNDSFKSKVRNADYALQVDELFSEEPFYYKDDQWDGYSDYTTLPSEYVEGGMLPYALAIHLSYRKNEDQLYVHHFVSDSNETNSDVRGKFREAACKIGPFFADKTQTEAVSELIEKANDAEGYPGLGYLKKLSIKNHLELILSLQQD